MSAETRRLLVVAASLAVVLGLGVVVEQVHRSPLDDPDPIRQRTGLLRSSSHAVVASTVAHERHALELLVPFAVGAAVFALVSLQPRRRR